LPNKLTNICGVRVDENPNICGVSKYLRGQSR
jgi:hypothetical protein